MPRSRLARWSRLLSSPIVRSPRLVLAACVALSLAALAPAMRIHVDSDLAALLPNGAPAADDYRVFLHTFGGFEKVFVLVRSPGRRLDDPGALEDAAAALAAEMGRSPEVADARSGRTEEDERFFYRYLAPRLPLLLAGDAEGGAGALAQSLTPAAIHRRVAMMRQTLTGPAGSALGPLYASDPLGLSEGLLAAASAAIPMDPVSGAFLSHGGDVALVMLTPAQAEIDPAGGRALIARLDAAYARVRAASPVPLEFQAVGGPIYAAQDEGILRSDLARSGFSTVAGVAAVLLAGFEGLLLPAAILVAVLAGILWTAGVTGLAMPAMTVVGVGFAAALVGMGVDYGIHGGVQYRQLRLPAKDGGGGASMAAALAGAFRDTGPGVLTAALSTAACLAALATAHFRPLREIGKVLALGVLATLLATVTLSAALVAGFPGAAVRPPARPRLWARWGQPGLRALARVAVGWPWTVVAAALGLSVFGAWGLSRAALSTDLRALRPANAPSVAAEKLLVESFSLGLDTLSVVVRGRDLDQALDRADAIAALLRRRLGAGVEIATPSDWLVLGSRRERRLAELRRLPLARAADDLERELTAAGFRIEPFSPALAALRGLARGEDPGAPPPAAWPSWMKELVRTGAGIPGVPPGGAAVAVHARLPLGHGGAAALPPTLPRELAQVAPGAALAAVARVGAELKDLALADLLRSSAVALALVAAVVLVSFRGHLGRALLAFLPLTLGCLWTFGTWSACGRSYDLLAVFTVPLLVGTGINLGAHAVHWQRLYPHRGLAGAVEDIGLAMMMAAFTTALGFGSLVTSRVPGLAHDGVLVAAGITACLLATLLVLPALEELRARRARRTRRRMRAASSARAAAGGQSPRTPQAPPHAPETSRARRLLGPFHVTGVFWYRFHGGGVRIWPSSQMWMVITFFTTFFFLTLIKIRGAVGRNLEAVLGRCGWPRRQLRIYRTMWTFAWCLTERYERLRTTRPFHLRADGIERWAEVCGSGNGFILVTAHVGNWEVGSMFPAAAEARAVHVVREAESDPRAQEYVAELIRKQGGGLYITHFAEDPRLGMLLLDALRRGEIVALQGDRPRTGGRVAGVTLFGRPFPLPVGPAALARAAGVPLVPVFVFREGRRRYRAEIRPPILVPPAAESPAGIEEALRHFAAELERAIAAEPHQWFCFRRLWR